MDVCMEKKIMTELEIMGYQTLILFVTAGLEAYLWLWYLMNKPL